MFSSTSCRFSAGSPDPVYDSPSRIIESGKDPAEVRLERKQAPKLTNYQELKQLSLDPFSVDKTLKRKLDLLFGTAFIENYSSKIPAYHAAPELGKYLRVTTWNTEQSRRVASLLRDLESTEHYLETKGASAESAALALHQRELMKHSDLLVLQEMDIGHPRSHYLHTAQAMAKQLGMNYAYGVQYLEVDPFYLGIEDTHITNRDRAKSGAVVKPEDRHRYHGLFGNAVLSRFPIKRAEIVPLRTVNYDWYREEARSFDFVETTRRSASGFLFHQRPHRELKLGSRAFLRVDLHIPELPLETLTVINVHLEIKLPVDKRRKQLEEILEQIKDIKNPVVLAGDFNSSAFSVAPTSLSKEVTRNVGTIQGLTNLILSLSEVTPVVQFRGVLNFFKNHQNPLALHVPILLENRQRKTFKKLRDFRFDDGGAFDFRGDKAYSRGPSGILSNSNQRCPKGFTSTFVVNRPIGPVGHEKLDWIFVKSFMRSPFDSAGSRRLAPQQAQTLKEFNRLGAERYSDHDPITLVLPLGEAPETLALSGGISEKTSK